MSDDAEESHGIFQFAVDDEDEDFFETPKPQRHFIDRSYKMTPTVHEVVVDRFKDKTGPGEVLHAVECGYVVGQYEESLALAKEYIRVNGSQPRPMRVTEASELAARCALKLERPKEAWDLFGSVEYLNARTNDYAAWKEICQAFTDIAITLHDSKSRSCLLHWAVLSIDLAIHLYTRAAHPDTPIAKVATAVELRNMEQMRLDLDNRRGEGVVEVNEQVLYHVAQFDEPQVAFLKFALLDRQEVEEPEILESSARDI
ncbi:hypothetical protein HK104_007708 [Borealophlyctis nickersoniae]|nr:hypothetical protein HK104_007708 [Borealophlyctis nickersoniae]